MSKKWTHTGAFQSFGTKPRNVNWSWSARNEDTKTVVVTLWQDRFERAHGSLTYTRVSYVPGEKPRSPGFNELMDNLAWARDNCEGRVSVIIAIARDPNARPRAIAECFPSKMKMKLTSLDVQSGSMQLVAEGL